jgi:hypothetical protein
VESLAYCGCQYWPFAQRGERGKAHGFLGVQQGQGVVVVMEGVWKAYPMKSFDMMQVR